MVFYLLTVAQKYDVYFLCHILDNISRMATVHNYLKKWFARYWSTFSLILFRLDVLLLQLFFYSYLGFPQFRNKSF